MNELMQMIENIGFPIALVLYLLYREDKRDDATKEERESLYDIIQKNTDALNLIKEQIARFFAYAEKEDK